MGVELSNEYREFAQKEPGVHEGKKWSHSIRDECGDVLSFGDYAPLDFDDFCIASTSDDFLMFSWEDARAIAEAIIELCNRHQNWLKEEDED